MFLQMYLSKRFSDIEKRYSGQEDSQVYAAIFESVAFVVANLHQLSLDLQCVFPAASHVWVQIHW